MVGSWEVVLGILIGVEVEQVMVVITVFDIVVLQFWVGAVEEAEQSTIVLDDIGDDPTV